MTRTLKTDQISSGKDKKVYGKKGDQVTIINHHGKVAIVADVRGNRFPVRKEDLE